MCQAQALKFPGLLDTGSPRSLIKTSLVQKLKIKISPPKIGQPMFLLTASDQKMSLRGTAILSLKIAGLQFNQEFIVVDDLSVICLLGRDFMKVSSCNINFFNQTVTLCDNIVSVNILKDFRVTNNLAILAENTVLKPKSKCLLPIILKNKDRKKGNEFLVEPLPTIYDQKYVVGKAIIKKCKNAIYIPISNPSEKTVKIKSRTPMAQLFHLTKDYALAPVAIISQNHPPAAIHDNSQELHIPLPNYPHIESSSQSIQNTDFFHTFNNNNIIPQNSTRQKSQTQRPAIFMDTPSNGDLVDLGRKSSFPGLSKSSTPLKPLPTQPKRTLQELGIKLDHLTLEQQNQASILIQNYSDVFANSYDTLRDYASPFTCQIGLKPDAQPVHLRNYKHSVADQAWIQQQCDEMEANGIIEKSLSYYNSPLLIVSNAAKGTRRLCLDCRAINKSMTLTHQPMIRIDEIGEHLAISNPKFFCSLDFLKGYHQVNLEESSKPLFGFSTTHFHYNFCKLPFGASPSSQIFTAILNDILQGLAPDRLIPYVDDVIVHSPTFEHMLESLEMIFVRLRENRFYLNANKCDFIKPEVTFLGFIVSEHRITPRPDRIKAILDLKPPENQKHIKSIMGMMNFYRRYIKNFSILAQPINRLLRKDTKFFWSKHCQESFDELKKRLSSPPILAFPQIHKKCTVTVDSSGSAVGYVITQPDEHNRPCIIDSGGCALSQSQAQWATIEQECFAVLCAN